MTDAQQCPEAIQRPDSTLQDHWKIATSCCEQVADREVHNRLFECCGTIVQLSLQPVRKSLKKVAIRQSTEMGRNFRPVAGLSVLLVVSPHKKRSHLVVWNQTTGEFSIIGLVSGGGGIRPSMIKTTSVIPLRMKSIPRPDSS